MTLGEQHTFLCNLLNRNFLDFHEDGQTDKAAAIQRLVKIYEEHFDVDLRIYYDKSNP